MAKTVADQEETSDLTFTIRSESETSIRLDIGNWPAFLYTNDDIAAIIIAINEAMYGDPKIPRTVMKKGLSAVTWTIRRDINQLVKIRVQSRAEYYLTKEGVDQVTKWLLEALSDPR